MADDLRWRVRSITETNSTNDDVRCAAEQGEADGLVICAERQMSGRGRHGRAWVSPPGNLYASILLRPDVANRKYGHYSFITALAIYDAVKAVLPNAAIALKWPNDVLVGGRKIAGILLEADADYLIIGTGLNIAHFPDNAPTEATSLHALGADVSVSAVLDQLLDSLGRWLDIYHRDGFSPVQAAWLGHAHRGAMTVKLPDIILQGVMLGIDETGALRLGLADGAERVISSGEVFLGTGQG